MQNVGHSLDVLVWLLDRLLSFSDHRFFFRRLLCLSRRCLFCLFRSCLCLFRKCLFCLFRSCLCLFRRSLFCLFRNCLCLFSRCLLCLFRNCLSLLRSCLCYPCPPILLGHNTIDLVLIPHDSKLSFSSFCV